MSLGVAFQINVHLLLVIFVLPEHPVNHSPAMLSAGEVGLATQSLSEKTFSWQWISDVIFHPLLCSAVTTVQLCKGPGWILWNRPKKSKQEASKHCLLTFTQSQQQLLLLAFTCQQARFAQMQLQSSSCRNTLRRASKRGRQEPKHTMHSQIPAGLLGVGAAAAASRHPAHLTTMQQSSGRGTKRTHQRFLFFTSATRAANQTAQSHVHAVSHAYMKKELLHCKWNICN